MPYDYNRQKIALFGDSLWDKIHKVFGQFAEETASEISQGIGWSGSSSAGAMNNLQAFLKFKGPGRAEINVHMGLGGDMHVIVNAYYNPEGSGPSNKFNMKVDSFSSRLGEKIAAEIKKHFGAEMAAVAG